MRKIRLYIAMSLNGMIARPDGSVDWLENIPNPDKTDYGYQAFYREIDTLLLNAGRIDELELFVKPVILLEGIGLFGGFPEQTALRLLKTQSFASGAVRMTYQVKNQNDA